MWPQSVCGGQLEPVLQEITGGTLGGCWLSDLFLVVRPLSWCLWGLLTGLALPLQAQWSFSSFVRFSLGTHPPSLAFLCSSQSGGVTDCFWFWQLVNRFKSVSGSDDISFLKCACLRSSGLGTVHSPQSKWCERIRWSQNVSVCCSSGGGLLGIARMLEAQSEAYDLSTLYCVWYRLLVTLGI